MRKLIVLIVISLSLVGCSTKFVYNHIDWLVLEFVEDYVELDEQQEDFVSDKINQLSEWHRREEIPNYIDQLDQLIAIEPSQFTIDDMRVHEQQIRAHSQRLVARVAPDLYQITTQLSDDQVHEFMDNLRIRHTKYKKKYQSLTDEEIKQRYRQRIEKNLDNWLGTLTQKQQQILTLWTNELQITSRDWVTHQTKMRVEINALLAERLNEALFKPDFQDLMFNPDSFYSPQLAGKIEYNREVARTYLTQIINTMSSKQTQHFRDELEDWKELALDIQ